MVKNNAKTIEESNDLAYGFKGFIDIVPETVLSGNDRFHFIEAEEDTDFSFKNDAEKGTTSSDAYPLKETKYRMGNFKNIVVTSGHLVAYYAK